MMEVLPDPFFNRKSRFHFHFPYTSSSTSLQCLHFALTPHPKEEAPFGKPFSFGDGKNQGRTRG